MLTKSEMKVLADELGIRKALGDNFAKLLNKPKPDVIAGLLAVKLGYTGLIGEERVTSCPAKPECSQADRKSVV